MSLLDNGPGYEPCVVFPEEVGTDEDGNIRTRPAKDGIPTEARFQHLGQSGTSARRQEQDNEGYETEKVYRVRFKRSFDDKYGPLGAQSEIQWKGKRWAVFGDPVHYNGSPRTRRYEYTIKRY